MSDLRERLMAALLRWVRPKTFNPSPRPQFYAMHCWHSFGPGATVCYFCGEGPEVLNHACIERWELSK